MEISEKSSVPLGQEEILRQEAIKVLEELAQKQNQASLLRLRFQQSFFYWSALSVLSLVILLFFGSSLFCTSPLIRNNNYCRDNSINSILIGLMTAPLCSISFIKAVNKRSFIKKLTDNLTESDVNYNQLFNAIYSSHLEKSVKQPSIGVPSSALIYGTLPTVQKSVNQPPLLTIHWSNFRETLVKSKKETSTNVSLEETIQ